MATVGPLTTHILDTSRGLPAAQVEVSVYIQDDVAQWKFLNKGYTNADGRCPGLLTEGQLTAAIYRMHFDTGSYFNRQNIRGFYPYVDIVFEVTDTTRHHHVPLLLSPFGYSTYRGS